jgi:hypothetical protein
VSPAPGNVMHRCAWCGIASSSTTGPRARLVPVPRGMLEYLAAHEQRHGHRVSHDDYATTGSRSTWWCRSVKSCARRRGGVLVLP